MISAYIFTFQHDPSAIYLFDIFKINIVDISCTDIRLKGKFTSIFKLGKELFILFTASPFRKLPSIYVFSYFPFWF